MLSWGVHAYPPGSSIFARGHIYPRVSVELIHDDNVLNFLLSMHACTRTCGSLLVHARTTMNLKITNSKAFCYYLANIVINSIYATPLI